MIINHILARASHPTRLALLRAVSVRSAKITTLDLCQLPHLKQ